MVKWPWLSTIGCIADRSSPRRSALVTMACGDRRVSKSTEVVVPPRRTVTSGEKPCSAISPTWVDPDSTCTRRLLLLGRGGDLDEAGVYVVDETGDEYAGR